VEDYEISTAASTRPLRAHSITSMLHHVNFACYLKLAVRGRVGRSNVERCPINALDESTIQILEQFVISAWLQVQCGKDVEYLELRRLAADRPQFPSIQLDRGASQ